MLQESTPTTDQLLAEAMGHACTRHRIDYGNRRIDLFLQSDRILAYRDDENTPSAFLRFGGPHSGAIWMGDRLVGEYDKDVEGHFIVIVVEDGFKQPDSMRQEDPVVHLMNLVASG